MYVWQNTIVDGSGNLLPNALVRVRDPDSLELVAIYADADGELQLQNPTKARQGFVRFYAPAGRYQVTASDGDFERVYEDVQLGFGLESMPPDLATLIREECAALAALAVSGFVEFSGYRCIGVGSINANGSAANLPAGWSSSYAGGVYTVNHDLALGSARFSVLLSATVANSHANPQPSSYSANAFQYRVFNDENGVITAPVRFALFYLD